MALDLYSFNFDIGLSGRHLMIFADEPGQIREMVQAMSGVLLKCDIPTKVFVASLNDQRDRSERFILEDLDSKHLFVQPTIVEELETRLKEFQDQNTYQPPRKEEICCRLLQPALGLPGYIEMVEDLAEIDSAAVKTALSKLTLAQQQRAQEYSKLNLGFQELLRTRDEQNYRARLEEATSSFQASSTQIRGILRDLEGESGLEDLCSLLRDLQKKEQAKLKYTLILQALRNAGADNKFSWQKQLASPSTGTADAEETTSLPVGPGGCCTHATEPTETEYTNALKEATQELQTAVCGINEIFEELQYLKEDL